MFSPTGSTHTPSLFIFLLPFQGLDLRKFAAERRTARVRRGARSGRSLGPTRVLHPQRGPPQESDRIVVVPTQAFFMKQHTHTNTNIGSPLSLDRAFDPSARCEHVRLSFQYP